MPVKHAPTLAYALSALLAGLMATSTRAGIELVEKLSGIRALNVLDRDSLPQFRNVLHHAPGL